MIGAGAVACSRSRRLKEQGCDDLAVEARLRERRCLFYAIGCPVRVCNHAARQRATVDASLLGRPSVARLCLPDAYRSTGSAFSTRANHSPSTGTNIAQVSIGAL